MVEKLKTLAFGALFLILVLGGLRSYGQSRTADTTESFSEAVELRIAPFSASEAKDVELFDSIVYFPLETNKQSEFAVISQLEITQKHYIIFDKSLQSLFFFNKDGSFYRKISEKSGGGTPVPFKRLIGFTVDESQNILSFRDNFSEYMYEFTSDGDFLRRVEIDPDTFTWSYVLFRGLKIDYYHYLENKADAGSPAVVVSDRVSGKKRAAHLPSDFLQLDSDSLFYGGRKRFNSSDDGKSLWFSRPYDYTFYELDSIGNLHERYKVVLPLANALPKDFLTDRSYDGKRKELLSGSGRSIFYAFENIYTKGDWLSFEGRQQTLLYRLSSGDLFNLRKIDYSTLGVPFPQVVPYTILGMDDGALVSSMRFEVLKTAYEEASKEERDMLPPSLMPVIKKRSHNPILQLLYLKTE